MERFDGRMEGWMGGVWMKDGGSWLLLNKFRVLVESVAFTLSTVTVPIITFQPLVPWH